MTHPTFHERAELVTEALLAAQASIDLRKVWIRAQPLLEDLRHIYRNPTDRLAGEAFALAKKIQVVALEAWERAGADQSFIPRVKNERAAGVLETAPTAQATSKQEIYLMADDFLPDDGLPVQSDLEGDDV